MKRNRHAEGMERAGAMVCRAFPDDEAGGYACEHLPIVDYVDRPCKGQERFYQVVGLLLLGSVLGMLAAAVWGAFAGPGLR